MEQALPEEDLEVAVLVREVAEGDVWEVTCRAPGPAAIVYAPHVEQQFLMKERCPATRFNVPNVEAQCFDSK